jgi:predicted DNA-binding transcriptional regulator YafY
MPANPTICAAIKLMKVVEFDYNDADGKPHHRVVEPYAYGVTAQGKSVLCGCQIEGSNGGGELPSWDVFRVDRMRNLRMLDRTFAGDAPGCANDKPDLYPIYSKVP